jgi:hypothetical protein
MAKQKSENASTIIPDSKIFISAEPVETGETKMLRCHVNGVAIADMNLAPHVLAVLDYWATDEGIAERNSRPGLVEPSGISLGADSFSKALHQRRDDVKDRGMETYEARDPMKEVATRYVAKGMRPKFLSANRVKESGGAGDYEIVKDERGDPVTVRGMVLGQMPEARAMARNKHYQQRGNQILKEMTAQYKREGGATAVSDQ